MSETQTLREQLDCIEERVKRAEARAEGYRAALLKLQNPAAEILRVIQQIRDDDMTVALRRAQMQPALDTQCFNLQCPLASKGTHKLRQCVHVWSAGLSSATLHNDREVQERDNDHLLRAVQARIAQRTEDAPIPGTFPLMSAPFEMSVDKPFSVSEFVEKAKSAGQDALGIANDPEAVAAVEAAKKINHHTREPNQPTTATIVDGEFVTSCDGPLLEKTATYSIKLERRGPGDVVFLLFINGRIHGHLPFDNVVKAATRIDPDHASGPEKEIRQLREQLAKANGRALQAEELLKRYEDSAIAFSEAHKA